MTIKIAGSRSKVIFEALPQDDPPQRQPDAGMGTSGGIWKFGLGRRLLILRDFRGEGGRGSFDLEYQLKGFGHLFHAVWRHASNQIRLFCIRIVKPFGIQRTDLEAKKYCILGKTRLTGWNTYVCGVISWNVLSVCSDNNGNNKRLFVYGIARYYKDRPATSLLPAFDRV